MDPHGTELPLFQYPPSYVLVFSFQLTLGWFGTISRFLQSLINKQTTYCQSISSRHTGPVWVKNSYLNCGKTYMVYGSNKIINSMETTINNNHGISDLHFSIQVKHYLGLLGLPPIYNSYFQTSLEDLLNKNIKYKKMVSNNQKST